MAPAADWRFMPVLCCLIAAPALANANGNGYRDPWYMPAINNGVCKGTIGECAAGDDFNFDAETNRRILQSNNGYIGYQALAKDGIPCYHRGASYYNCHAGAVANPYHRGCIKIQLCRG